MATRNRRTRNSDYGSTTCPPGWAWLLAGILIGMFISFLIYLQKIAPHTLPPENAQTQPPSLTAANTQPVSTNQSSQETTKEIAKETAKETTLPSKEQTKEPNNSFEFYDILPNAEVKIPPASTNPNEPMSEKDLPVTVPGKYLLQVGSFRSEQEAKGLQGYLVSLNIQANITEVILKEAEYWYRVQVGPFTDLDKLNQTRALLTENNIPAILLKFSAR